jgi:hypothetical protein
LKADIDRGALALAARLSPPQFLKAEEALGGRFELKEDVDLGALAQED